MTPRDVPRHQRGQIACPQTALRLGAAAGQREAGLLPRQPPEHREGRPVPPVASDLAELLLQDAPDRVGPRPEPEVLVEVEGPGPERLGVARPQLVGIHHHRAHAEDLVIGAEGLAEDPGRLPLPEGLEDVEPELQRLEEAPPAAVAHRHAVPDREEGVVALERQPEWRLEPDQHHAQPAPRFPHQHVLDVRIREGVELPRAGDHGDARGLDQLPGQGRRGAAKRRERPRRLPDDVDAGAPERHPLEDRALHRPLGHGSRDPRSRQADPHRQPETLVQPVPQSRVERCAVEGLDQHLEVGEAPPGPRHLEPSAHREAALAEGVALGRGDQEVQRVRDLLRVRDASPADVGMSAEPRRQPAAQRKAVGILEGRAGDAGVLKARLGSRPEPPDARGKVAKEAVYPAEDLAVVRVRLEKAERLVEPDERGGLGDGRGRDRRQKPPLGDPGFR